MLILHVEDDIVQARALKRHLNAKGHTIVHVATMQEFEALWQGSSKAPGGSFDLVITDGEFPGGNALMVVDHVTRDGIAVLVFSGQHDLLDRTHQAGAQFVGKPDTARLLAVIDLVKDRPHGSALLDPLGQNGEIPAPGRT